MSLRLVPLAALALGLSACDSSLLQTPVRQAAACCCQQCPTAAAPAAPKATAEAPPPAAARPHRVVYRERPVRVRSSSYYRYESSGEDLAGGGAYGGRYGARGGVRSGIRVYSSESETASSSYSYSEGGYAYGSRGGVVVTGGGAPGCPAPGCATPADRGYRMAGRDERGYLTWPGKVED